MSILARPRRSMREWQGYIRRSSFWAGWQRLVCGRGPTFRCETRHARLCCASGLAAMEEAVVEDDEDEDEEIEPGKSGLVNKASSRHDKVCCRGLGHFLVCPASRCITPCRSRLPRRHSWRSSHLWRRTRLSEAAYLRKSTLTGCRSAGGHMRVFHGREVQTALKLCRTIEKRGRATATIDQITWAPRHWTSLEGRTKIEVGGQREHLSIVRLHGRGATHPAFLERRRYTRDSG